MSEYILLINMLLFLSISVILTVYFKKTWKANAEYNKAKNVIEEVILSFNKEIQSLRQKIGEIDIKFQNIQILDVNQIKSELDDLSSKTEKLLNLYSILEKKIENMEININRLSETTNRREVSFEDTTMEHRLPIKPAFNLKREKALAPLTSTELRVLEILSTEGDKTVREIRSRIGLTREHTGRLMKSLYDKGYVERRTDKIPYVYRIKKEMENILANNSESLKK